MKSLLVDQFVPAGIVGIIIMMILPLPKELLDCLLTINLAFSIALLLSAVSIRRPERYTVLPSVLLLSTLFRLALNIATTRQLLGTGEAPDLVAAFGHFVVGGNLIVGGVVFLIITLVQFIVISKGAERVAEVAARFTLDAMPGKQMSIDADLRAGVLSVAEARDRRVELQRESRLYGALDGAMKFIKGDAIAGLVITALNIFAGIIIGTTIHGLDLATAASRYTIFTVGDGLVSQIPALLVSIAAGMAVTRVAGPAGSSIGEELFEQIAERAAVPAITGLLLLALAVLPGLPVVPLATLSLVAGLIALHVRSKGLIRNKIEPETFRPRGSSPITLRVSPDALAALRETADFVQRVQALRKRVFDEWGFIMVEPELEIDLRLGSSEVELRRFGAPIGKVNAARAVLAETLLRVMTESIEGGLEEHIDDTQTRLLLEAHECRCEDLINSVIPSQLSVTRLTKLLRQLLAEGVPIKNLSGILQGVLEWSSDIDAALPREIREDLLLATVREKLARVITESIIRDRKKVKALELSAKLELLLQESVLSAAPILTPIQNALVSQLRKWREDVLFVLCGPLARVKLGRLVVEHGIKIPILARSELCPGAEIIVAGRLIAPGEDEIPVLRAA